MPAEIRFSKSSWGSIHSTSRHLRLPSLPNLVLVTWQTGKLVNFLNLRRYHAKRSRRAPSCSSETWAQSFPPPLRDHAIPTVTYVTFHGFRGSVFKQAGLLICIQEVTPRKERTKTQRQNARMKKFVGSRRRKMQSLSRVESVSSES